MKIGYLLQAGAPDIRSNPLSGPANHVKQVFDELRRLGHEVRLLARLDGRIWKSDDFANFEPVVIRWLDRGPVRLLERGVRRTQYELQLPYAGFFESYRFAQACRAELADCDLLYERMGWMGYGGGLAARRMRKPLVLEVNGDHLDELDSQGIAPRGLQRKLSVTLMKQAARRVDYVVATGEGWRRRYIDRWGIDPARATVVENGTQMVDLLQREQLRSFRPWSEVNGPVTVLYIGAFEPWHGLDILLPAVAKALGRGVALCAVLAGTGPERENLIHLIQELGITDNVTLPGHLDAGQLADQLAGADIGVSPYCGRAEYSGLKLLDYKAAGLATIASGEDGQPAVLEHARTGWIVPPCDIETLGEAIVKLCSDHDLRQQLGRAARIEAEERHSWRQTALDLEQTFIKALES